MPHELVKAETYILTGTSSKIELQYALKYNRKTGHNKHGSKVEEEQPEMQLELTTHSGDAIWNHNRFSAWSGILGASGFCNAIPWKEGLLYLIMKF